jgi:hypothetical protein
MTRPPRSAAATRDRVGVEQHQHEEPDGENRAEGGANVEPGRHGWLIGTTDPTLKRTVSGLLLVVPLARPAFAPRGI